MSTQDIAKELKEMSKSLVENNPPEVKEEIKVDPIVEDEEKEEPGVEEEVKEEAKEAPVVEVKEEVKEDLSKTVADLRAKLAELEVTKVEPKVETKIEELKVEDQDFLKDLDFDDVTRSPEELNKVLNMVHSRSVISTQKAIMDKIPSLVSKQLEAVQLINKISEDFYKDNPDLVEFKKVVSLVWKEMAEKEPDKSMADAVKAIAPEVRKRLGLAEPKSKPEVKPELKKKDKVPTLPKKGSSSGKIEASGEKSGTLSAQISDMNKALG